MTLVDGLTGLGNRRKLEEYLGQTWGQVCRQHIPVCAMLMDIDYFKDYNDTYGHLAGDDCLKKVSSKINDLYRRAGDLAVRYGGEEFLILFIDCDRNKSISHAESLRKEIEDLMIEHRTSQVFSHITVGIGIASMVPDKILTPEMLLEAADKALYRAKNQGRNRVCLSPDQTISN